MKKAKLGFIGTGVMGGAMLAAVVKTGYLPPEDILIYDKDAALVQRVAAATGAVPAASAAALARGAAVVQLGSKPQDFPVLLEEIGAALAESDPLVISIAAGLELRRIEALLPYQPRLVRTMQNINATIGESMTAFCPNERVTAEERAFVEGYCGCFGKAVQLEERHFSAFLALAGSAPAFVYLFIDELARAGVACGMGKALALEVAAQTVLGSAKLLQGSELHPYQLIDRVCSPAGTTIAGVEALQEYGFANALHKAVHAAYDRDRALASG
ncbi:MAG: pyrroline-5-carboxylate reductase [Oscillospiraceae bacterium]|nr:pyrroline-5-carboxylate reductase [Oscillospiraceae bacterium]